MERKDNKLSILVVEDNEQIIEALEFLLEKQGYNADIVKSKKDAITYIEKQNYDLVLLDVQLPDGTGFEVCKHLRKTSDIPVIFLTGRTEEINVVYGLDIGADDYITKPFGNNELISRINTVMRRYKKSLEESKTIIYKNIKVDIDNALVYNGEEEVFLSKLEYKILLMFLNNKNKLITREQLLEKIWDVDGNYVNDNTLSVYIKRLRQKIGDTSKNEMIKTIRGIGYRLD